MKDVTIKKGSFIRGAWARYRKNVPALIGLIIVGVVIFLAVFADVLAPYEEMAMEQNRDARLLGPCLEHLLGTGACGRDSGKQGGDCGDGRLGHLFPPENAAAAGVSICGERGYRVGGGEHSCGARAAEVDSLHAGCDFHLQFRCIEGRAVFVPSGNLHAGGSERLPPGTD